MFIDSIEFLESVADGKKIISQSMLDKLIGFKSNGLAEAEILKKHAPSTYRHMEYSIGLIEEIITRYYRNDAYYHNFSCLLSAIYCYCPIGKYERALTLVDDA